MKKINLYNIISQVSIKLEKMQETGFKIFLGSLPPHLTNEQIVNLLKKYGNVSKAHLLFHKKTGFCKGFGHIIVGDQATYERILKAELKIDGRKIFKEPFLEGKKLSDKKEKFVSKRIFVSNLPYGISDSELKQTFGVFGTVEQAYRIISTDGKRQPYGFVLFDSPNDAKKCHEEGQVTFTGHQIKCRLFVNFDEKRKKFRQKKRASAESLKTDPKKSDKKFQKQNRKKKSRNKKKARNNFPESQDLNSETSPTIQNKSQPSHLHQPSFQHDHNRRDNNLGYEIHEQYEQDRPNDYCEFHQSQNLQRHQNLQSHYSLQRHHNLQQRHLNNLQKRPTQRRDQKHRQHHRENNKGRTYNNTSIIYNSYLSQQPYQMIQGMGDQVELEAIFRNSKEQPWMSNTTLYGVSENHSFYNIRLNPLDENSSVKLKPSFLHVSSYEIDGQKYSIRRR